MKKIILLLSMLLCFSSNVTFSSNPAVDQLLHMLQSIGMHEKLLVLKAEMEGLFSGVDGWLTKHVTTDQFSLAQIQANLSQIQQNAAAVSVNEGKITEWQDEIKSYDKTIRDMRSGKNKEKHKGKILSEQQDSREKYQKFINDNKDKNVGLNKESAGLKQVNEKLHQQNDVYCRQVGGFVQHLAEFSADEEVGAFGQSMTVEKWLNAIARTKDTQGVKVFDGDGVRGGVAQAISDVLAQVKQNQADREGLAQQAEEWQKQEAQKRKEKALVAAQLAEKRRQQKEDAYPDNRTGLVAQVEAIGQGVKDAALQKLAAGELQFEESSSGVVSVMELFSGYEDAGRFGWNDRGRFVVKEGVVEDSAALQEALSSMNALMLDLAFSGEEKVSLAPLYSGNMSSKKLLGYLKRAGSRVVEEILEARTAEFYVDQEEQAQDEQRFDFDEYDSFDFLGQVAASFKQSFELDAMWKRALVDVEKVEDQFAQSEIKRREDEAYEEELAMEQYDYDDDDGAAAYGMVRDFDF